MQRQSFCLRLKNFQENGTFSGYGSVFNVIDQQGESISKGAFQKSLKSFHQNGGRPKMLWQHDPKEPIGYWTKVVEDDHGLYVEGQLILELQKAQEAYHLMKAGVLNQLSIGFIPIRSHFDPAKSCRVISEVDLVEISLVTFAANNSANITSVKTSYSEQNVWMAVWQKLCALNKRLSCKL